jgi:hypothetical protein
MARRSSNWPGAVAGPQTSATEPMSASGVRVVACIEAGLGLGNDRFMAGVFRDVGRGRTLSL